MVKSLLCLAKSLLCVCAICMYSDFPREASDFPTLFCFVFFLFPLKTAAY